MTESRTICVVGLGYVGLPLAHAFARSGHRVFGYDVKGERIEELRRGSDRNGELTEAELRSVQITFSEDPAVIAECNVILLAIPTPIDAGNNPDLTPLVTATRTVGRHLQSGSIVVVESTVYPGTTEEICGKLLEEESRLTAGKDFTLGYSPERINPGDREHSIDRIVKVVAGQDAATADTLCSLYGSITTAGVHRAPSIKVAEMAKAIENAQRDLNVAFVNEIAVLCHALGISTQDVLAAARTKWNFLPFSPGLVGGHCIGVDPYYLVAKARQLGIDTHVITAGRARNDAMGQFVGDAVHVALGASGKRILVLGLTFKENVSDTRNSKSGDVIARLQTLGHRVEVHDPHVSESTMRSSGWLPGDLEHGPYDAIVLLVPHREYRTDDGRRLVDALTPSGLLYDLKGILNRTMVEGAGRTYAAL